MSRFKQIKYPQNDPALESVYKDAIEIGWESPEPGVPINFVTAFSERPDLCSVIIPLAKAVMMEGQLPPTVAQMICMTIAVQNDCRYCAVAHSYALEAMGVAEEVIKSCASDPDLSEIPPPQRAIVKFALKLARNSKSATDEDYQILRDFGLSDGEILEIISLVGYANFADLLADAMGVVVDGEESS